MKNNDGGIGGDDDGGVLGGGSQQQQQQQQQPAAAPPPKLAAAAANNNDNTTTSSSSLHSKIALRESENRDLFKKYEVLEILGQGSMGAVSKARIRPEAVGGSAHHKKPPKTKGLFRFGTFIKRVGLISNHNKQRQQQQQQQTPVQPRRSRSPIPPIQRRSRTPPPPPPPPVSSSLTGTNTSAHGGGGGGVADTADSADDGGSTRSATVTCTDHLYALKSIQLDRVSTLFLDELKNEIEILRSMDHPNIVKSHEVYIYQKQIFLVLELCEGGDLYTRTPYSEYSCARIITQLLSAIRYMHERGIIHRDLKFENICFESHDDNAVIKVIDFGLSKKFLSGSPGIMTDRVGTIYTMSPQVIEGIYTSQADLWSIGVITYMLLSSTKPFNHRKKRIMIERITKGKYYPMTTEVWSHISDHAKHFVSQLLQVNPRIRMDTTTALDHPWIINQKQLSTKIIVNNHNDSSAFALSEGHDDGQTGTQNDVTGSFLNYVHTSDLKKLALLFIAHRARQHDIELLRDTFEKYDTERNGVLSWNEFKTALQKSGQSEEEMQEIFNSIDVNQNGEIMYTEFLAATIEALGFIEEERIAEAFDRLDCDDTGYISRENLRDVLGNDVPKHKIDTIIASADKNGDGKISYDEFLTSFREQTYQLTKDMMMSSQMENTNSGIDERRRMMNSADLDTFQSAQAFLE